jgi:hypothetical protein
MTGGAHEYAPEMTIRDLAATRDRSYLDESVSILPLANAQKIGNVLK